MDAARTILQKDFVSMLMLSWLSRITVYTITSGNLLPDSDELWTRVTSLESKNSNLTHQTRFLVYVNTVTLAQSLDMVSWIDDRRRKIDSLSPFEHKIWQIELCFFFF